MIRRAWSDGASRFSRYARHCNVLGIVNRLTLREGLAPIQIFGEDRAYQSIRYSQACRDTGPPSRRVFVFLGFVLQRGANRLTQVSACSRFASTRRALFPATLVSLWRLRRWLPRMAPDAPIAASAPQAKVASSREVASSRSPSNHRHQRTRCQALLVNPRLLRCRPTSPPLGPRSMECRAAVHGKNLARHHLRAIAD
jgi:hypothetical protein